MSEEIGWSGAPVASPTVSPEILDDGRSRWPGEPGPLRRWSGPLALGLTAVVAVAYLSLDRPDPPLATAPTVPTVRAAINPAPVQGEPVGEQLVALEQSREPFQDIVLPAANVRSCHAPRDGQWPLTPATEALRTRLPGYVVVGSARWVDQDADLCEVSLQALGPGSGIAVVTITPPTDPPDPPVAPQLSRSISGGPGLRTSTSTVVAVVSDGWVIQVGAIGPQKSLPAVKTLTALAGDRRLRW